MDDFKALRIVCGQIEENAYLVYLESGSDAFLVDPGEDYDRIMEAIRYSGKRVTDIILTHGHFDHIYSASRLREELSAKITVHAADERMLSDRALNLGPKTMAGFTADREITLMEDGIIEFCGIPVRVIHTPGHTAGSICLYIPEYSTLFSGDTLFESDFGRTDLPGGSPSQMRRSLKKLIRLPGETIVHPGHGNSTSIIRVIEGFR